MKPGPKPARPGVCPGIIPDNAPLTTALVSHGAWWAFQDPPKTLQTPEKLGSKALHSPLLPLWSWAAGTNWFYLVSAKTRAMPWLFIPACCHLANISTVSPSSPGPLHPSLRNSPPFYPSMQSGGSMAATVQSSLLQGWALPPCSSGSESFYHKIFMS